MDTNQRLDRPQRHPANRPVHGRGRSTVRRPGHRTGTLSFAADAVLVQRVGRLSSFPMRGGKGSGIVAHRRHCARAVSRIVVAAVSFAGNDWPRFSRFSMGQSAARSRIPRHFLRAVAVAAPKAFEGNFAATNRALVAVAAVVQARVFLRLRETVQRRPELAQSHRAHVSLSNPAAAHLDWLVCATTAAVVPENVLRRDVWHRAGRAVSDFRAAPAAVLRRRGDCLSPNPDPADRQLHLLQLADAGAVPAAARRLCSDEIRSFQAAPRLARSAGLRPGCANEQLRAGPEAGAPNVPAAGPAPSPSRSPSCSWPFRSFK